MILYIASILLCLVSYSIPQLRKSLLWYNLCMCILCVFLCFGYMTGSDWRQYEPMYNEIDFHNLFYNYFAEPGYYIYMLIFKFMHFSFWNFFILTKVIIFFLCARIINEYVPEFRFLVWMFFLPWFGFYLFIDNPMRNLIAVAIFLYASRYIINRSFLKYCICICMAVSFHFSATIFFPLYSLFTKRISTLSFIVFFVIFIGISINRDLFSSIIEHVFGSIPYIQKKIEFYIMGDNPDGEGKGISLGMFIHLFFFILLLLYRNRIEQTKSGTFILNASLFYLLIYRLGSTIDIFSRFQLYLSVFYSIGIVLLINIFTRSSRYIYIISLLCLSFIASSKIFSYKYIPYTNYLYYILIDEYPSFEYRSDYNYRNTPYSQQ